MKNSRKNNEEKPLIFETKAMHRREFLKKTGLTFMSLGMVPVLMRCDDSEGIKEKFYFAVLSDTHIYPDAHSASEMDTNIRMKATAEILNSHEPAIDFVFITGDLVDYNSDEAPVDYIKKSGTSLDNLKKIIALFDMPVYPVMGNHDYYTGELGGTLGQIWETHEDRRANEKLYKDAGIIPETYYKVSHKGVSFFGLNSMYGDESLPWLPELVGTFGQEQIDWLKDEMADGKPAFMFFHHGLVSPINLELSMGPFELPYEGYDGYTGGKYREYTDPLYTDVLENDMLKKQVKSLFVGHTHAFVSEEFKGVAVNMTEALKGDKDYDTLGKPMRYTIVECEEDTGNFIVFNEDVIVYTTEEDVK